MTVLKAFIKRDVNRNCCTKLLYWIKLFNAITVKRTTLYLQSLLRIQKVYVPPTMIW